MSERSWNFWPWTPPRPRKARAFREHTLAEPPSPATCRAWRDATFPGRHGCRLGAPVCLVLLLLYAIPVGVLLALYAPDLDPPPTVSEPMTTRDWVDPNILIPVAEMPASESDPEPALELDGTPYAGEGGVE